MRREVYRTLFLIAVLSLIAAGPFQEGAYDPLPSNASIGTKKFVAVTNDDEKNPAVVICSGNLWLQAVYARGRHELQAWGVGGWRAKRDVRGACGESSGRRQHCPAPPKSRIVGGGETRGLRRLRHRAGRRFRPGFVTLACRTSGSRGPGASVTGLPVVTAPERMVPIPNRPPGPARPQA